MIRYFLFIIIIPILIFAEEAPEKLPKLAAKSSETILPGRGYVGVTFSVKHSKGENFKELNLIPIEQKDQLKFSINAQGGYLIRKYFSVGGGLSYGYSRVEAQLSDTLTTRSAQSTYAVVPHIRNYLPWTEDLFFQIFNQTNLGFSYGTGVEESDYGYSIDRTVIRELGIHLGIQPGLSVFVGRGVTVETSVSLLGFTSKRIKIEQNGIDYGYHNSSSVDFNIDLFSINLGITVYI